MQYVALYWYTGWYELIQHKDSEDFFAVYITNM